MKHLKTKFIVVFLCILAIGFKKQEVVEKNLFNQNKIESWFAKLAPKSTGLKMVLKEKLLKNLKLEQSWTINGGPDKSLLIVPIKENYKLKNNAEKNVQNFFALSIDELGNYKNGVIWQIPKENIDTKKIFEELYDINNLNATNLQGNYYLLDIWDNFIYELKYENGKRKTLNEMEARRSDTQLNSNLVCTNWYLVHTEYNTQTGEIISQTSEYLYTTCSCGPGNTVQTTIDETNGCDENSGGGGSSGSSTETAEIKEKTFVWTSYYETSPVTRSCTNMEKVTGIRYPNSSPQPAEANYFTGNTHVGQSFSSSTVRKLVNDRFETVTYATMSNPNSSNSFSLHRADVTFLGTVNEHTGNTKTINESNSWLMFIDFF